MINLRAIQYLVTPVERPYVCPLLLSEKATALRHSKGGGRYRRSLLTDLIEFPGGRVSTFAVVVCSGRCNSEGTSQLIFTVPPKHLFLCIKYTSRCLTDRISPQNSSYSSTTEQEPSPCLGLSIYLLSIDIVLHCASCWWRPAACACSPSLLPCAIAFVPPPTLDNFDFIPKLHLVKSRLYLGCS